MDVLIIIIVFGLLFLIIAGWIAISSLCHYIKLTNEVKNNATSYMFIKKEPTYKQKTVNTGYTYGYGPDSSTRYEHYAYADVFDGYEYHFQVYFKGGEVKHISAKERSMLYSAIVSKPEIRYKNTRSNFIYNEFYF